MAINWPVQKLSNRANASFRSTNLFTDFFVTICPFQLADAIPPTAVDDKKGRLDPAAKLVCIVVTHNKLTRPTVPSNGAPSNYAKRTPERWTNVRTPSEIYEC